MKRFYFSFLVLSSLILLISACGKVKKSTGGDIQLPPAPVITGVSPNATYTSGVTINVKEVPGITCTASIRPADLPTSNVTTFNTFPFYYDTEGNHLLEVTAVKESNGLRASTSLNFTIDSSVPGTPELTVIDGNTYPGPVTVDATQESGCSYEATLDGTSFELGTVVSEETSYTLVVTVTRDSNGLSNTVTVNFTINSTLPGSPVISGITDEATYIGPVTPVLENNEDGVSYEAEIDGTEHSLGSVYSSAGSHTLVVTATRDDSGTEITTSLDFTITDPQVAGYLSAPDLAAEDDSGVSDSDDITNITNGLVICGRTISEGSVKFYIDGVQDNSITADGQGNWGTDISKSDGEYSIIAVISDSAGNTATTNTLSLVIDTKPPSIPQRSIEVESISISGVAEPEPDNRLTTNSGTHNILVHWWPATDNVSVTSDIVYLPYYHDCIDAMDSPAMSTVNEVEAETAFGTYKTPDNLLAGSVAGMIGQDITGLDDANYYVINVVAMDQAGNKAVYQKTGGLGPIYTQDGTPPVPGNSGTVVQDSLDYQDLVISWTEAEDNSVDNLGRSLKYRVYKATESYSTVTDIENNADPVKLWEVVGFDPMFGFDEYDWVDMSYTSSLTSINIIAEGNFGRYYDQMYGETRYFYIIAKDDWENKVAYQELSVTFPDLIDPVAQIAADDFVTTNVTTSSIGVSWSRAVDNVTTQSALEYKVYYSLADDISTVSDAQNNGTAFGDWTADMTSATVTGLDEATTYYFTVLVRDESGRIDDYNTISAETLDETAPVPGNGGTISTEEEINAEEEVATVTLNWTAATDTITEDSQLEYRVYTLYSGDDGSLDTVQKVLDSGTVETPWTTNMTDAVLTYLVYDSWYKVNILVRDSAGNIECYTENEIFAR